MARITKEEKDQRKKMAFLLSYLVNEKKHADKITQKKIAKDLYVDPKTITNWTTGKSVPPVNQYEFIAKYFGYDRNIFDRLDDVVVAYDDLDNLIVRYRINEKVMKEYKISFLNCEERQFDFYDCVNDVASTPIDRLPKAEERSETNLKHYIDVIYMDDDVYSANLKASAIGDFNKSEADDFYKWLLLPYEKPKPKYKLSQLEFDLLNVQEAHWYSLNSLGFLERLIAKGYFKGIPPNISIKDILDNCEVIQND